MDDSSQQPATQHCTTDHADHRALISHDEVLSYVQNWLGCSADIGLATEAPILLTKKQQKNASDVSQQQSIAILRIDNPQTLSSILDDAVLPYVCRAFDQDISTVDPTILQEHKDHLTKGDVLFCAVLVDERESAKRPTQDECYPPRFVAHLLVSMIAVEATTATTTSTDAATTTANDSTTTNKKIMNTMCIVGRVCDPDWQHQGISTHVQSTALRSLQPDIVATRTANPAIFKLIRKAGRINNKLLLFPHDCASEDDWNVARQLGNRIVTEWDHLRNDMDKYDADRLVFRNLYSVVNQKIFGGKRQKNDDATFLQPGDAALCVLVL